MERWKKRLLEEEPEFPEPRETLGPAITWIRCDRCLTVLQKGELYGECDGRILCSECADEEWGELSDEEKLELLGFEVVV